MSFSREIKEYLLDKEELDIVTILGIKNSVKLVKNDNYYIFNLKNIKLARKLRQNDRFKDFLEIDHSSDMQKVTIYIAKDKFDELIEDEFDIRNKKNRASYLKGVFLGKGYMMDYRKEYHLEIFVANLQVLSEVKYLLDEYLLKYSYNRKNNSFYVYIKESESLINFLNIIGAVKYALEIEDFKVMKDLKNNLNRQTNCEVANLDKIIEASNKYIEIIEMLKEQGLFDKLSSDVKEVALLRCEHPNISLRELGELMDPPMSKYAVNYRMKKIEKMIERG